MERASKRSSWRAAPVFRPGDRDLLELESDLPSSPAPDRGLRRFADWIDGVFPSGLPIIPRSHGAIVMLRSRTSPGGRMARSIWSSTRPV